MKWILMLKRFKSDMLYLCFHVNKLVLHQKYTRETPEYTRETPEIQKRNTRIHKRNTRIHTRYLPEKHQNYPKTPNITD